MKAWTTPERLALRESVHAFAVREWLKTVLTPN